MEHSESKTQPISTEQETEQTAQSSAAAEAAEETKRFAAVTEHTEPTASVSPAPDQTPDPAKPAASAGTESKPSEPEAPKKPGTEAKKTEAKPAKPTTPKKSWKDSLLSAFKTTPSKSSANGKERPEGETAAILRLVVLILGLGFFICGIVGLCITRFIPIGTCACIIGGLFLAVFVVRIIMDQYLVLEQTKRSYRYISLEKALEVANSLDAEHQAEAKLLIIKELLQAKEPISDPTASGGMTSAGITGND